jgi:thiol-disulfide isomerase/thioredoxin
MTRSWPWKKLCLRSLAILCGVLATIAMATLVPWRGLPHAAQGAEPRLPPAPAFALPDLDGRIRTLAEFLGGKPILLEFMSSGCPHCAETAPTLTRLHATYGGRVQFLTVAFDSDARRVRNFAQQEKHIWPYLMGNEEVIDAFKLEGVPTFLFVTPEGRIGGRQVGAASYEIMSRGIETMLGGRR